MKAFFRGLAAVLAAAAFVLPASGQQGGDSAEKMQQLKQMCGDPKMAAMPMMAGVCGQMGGIGDALNAKPPDQNTMQGGGPGMAKPGAQGGLPDKAGVGAEAAAQGAAGAMPQAGAAGQAGADGGAMQQSGGGGAGMTYGGGPGQSHIPSIKTGFRQMNKPAFRIPVKAPEKVKAEAAAEESKKKEEEGQKKALEKLAAEAKARAAADAAALAKKAAAEAAAAVPPPPPPPPPVYENLVPNEFMVEASLFKDVDASAEYFGPRRVTDVVIPPSRPSGVVRGGIVWETMPEYRFALCPLDHDPFNLGLPKRISMKRSFWDRVMDKASGLFGRGKKRSGPALIPYAAFESGAVDQRMDLLGAGGIVPMSLYWSGPDGALHGPAPSASSSPGVPAATGLEPSGGEDDPAWLARPWGLEP
ncbi:MAG: hypothetical protein WC943_03845 [Elusimicrobiota bacterium]